jgi:ATP-dependent helicase HrpA
VTLFGLVIVPSRAVAFSRIDPAEAARIFVRSALVGADVKRPLPFLIHNQALRETVAAMEEKLRRHDLLIGEEEMAQFYEQRLPGICDIRSLHRLIRNAGSDVFLRMTEEDLLARPPDPEDLASFPSTVVAGGWRLDCIYRYEPGKPLDGITLKVPAHAAPALPSQSLDWVIPGLVKEKILVLLKGLPKEYRKRLLPLNQTGGILLQAMERQGPLPTALSRAVFRKFGIEIPADLWPLDRLEERLKLRYAVVDDGERELAAGRDIGILRQDFSTQGETKAWVEARTLWEKTGLTGWDFGDVPERVALTADDENGPFAFPALAASDTGVSLRLFRSEGEARASHRRGVQALLVLRLPQELRHLRKSVCPAGDLKLWSAAFGGAKALEHAVMEKVLFDLFEVECRTAEAFHSHADAIRPRICSRGQEVIRVCAPVIMTLYEVSSQIRKQEAANAGNKPVLTFLAGLREELTRLVPPDFLIRYPEERLGHISRYLRGVAVRAERGAVHLEKVLTRGKELEDLVARYREIIRTLPPCASEDKIRDIEEFHWLLEEFTISLFAQELKTPFPVSRKRLEAKLREIERMV